MAIPSEILEGKPEHNRQMNEWLAGQNFQWRLCYRASSDGWGATDFHSKCDNQGPTIVIVQVGNYIFGGFTNCNWSPRLLTIGTYENCTSVDVYLFYVWYKNVIHVNRKPI